MVTLINNLHEVTRKGKRICTGYLRHAFDHKDLELTISWIKSVIEKAGRPDALVFTGMSGALITPILSRELDIPMIMVRKADASSHSSYSVEGWEPGGYEHFNYIIIDDLIDSGSTIKSIVSAIDNYTSVRRITSKLGYIVCYTKHNYCHRSSFKIDVDNTIKVFMRRES